MADPGRLDELKRKFDENPRRYFAPLANEYRKAGDAERAIELCRTYLPQQPTHMSGYIVYGQALFDAERTDEASAVFQQALTLDPENIIALRYLGDIARAKGDRSAAIRWYGKVMELDPRNDEITEMIAELASPDQPRRYEGPERPVPPTIRPEPEEGADGFALEELLALPDTPQAEIILPVEPAPSVTTIQTADESVTIIRWPTDDEETRAGMPVDEPVAGASVESMMDFGLDEPFAAQQSGEAPLAEGADDESPVSFGASEEGSESYGAEDFTGEPLAGGSLAPTSYAPREESSLVDESEWSMDDQSDHSPSSGGPFITETMAELYVAQGMRGEALAIYRELVARRDDPRLQARIAELEAEEHGAGTNATEEVAAPESHDTDSGEPSTVAADGAAAERAPEAAADESAQTRGETVREFFARIGARRADAAPHIGADGESELSRLFGAAPLDASDVGAAQSLAGAFTTATPDDAARSA